MALTDGSPRNGGPKTEIRLALVMNGGVSLAVWMGGVTHELDLLRRASRNGAEPDAGDHDRHVFRIWKEIAEAANADVVIDIVSGTSAGGLNGMLLATSLGRSTALPPLRTVWEQSASLDRLLVNPTGTSILNGAYFADTIAGEVDAITENGPPGHPVTLFMTATGLDGRARRYEDGYRNAFEVHDHRRVYRFRSDARAVTYGETSDGGWDFAPEHRYDFAGDDSGALARAARASAGFPVAFPPVAEEPLLEHRRTPPRTVSDGVECVIDGGVLNNAPFGPVLEAIAEREYDKPVRRVVVYVVPSAGLRAGGAPDGTDGTAGRTVCEDAPFHRVAQRAFAYPREADFRTGTEDLARRVGASTRDAQLELFTRMAGRIAVRGHVRDAAENLLDEYRHARAGAVLWEARKRLTERATVTPLVTTPQAHTEEIDRILGAEPSWSPRSDPAELRRPDLGAWPWGLVATERIFETLSTHLHDLVVGRDPANGAAVNGKGRTRLLQGAEAISGRLRRALAVKDAVRRELDRLQRPGGRLSDEAISQTLDEVFTRLRVPERMGELVREAGTAYAASLNELGLREGLTCEEVVIDCLAVEVNTGVYAPSSMIVEPNAPEFRFLRLGPDVTSPLFDEELFARLGDPARKLYGLRFQHFGAFVKSDWRRSDFAWGRLDAAHHLLGLLIEDPEERRERERELHRAVLEAEGSPRAHSGTPVEWLEGNLADLQQKDGALLKTVLDSDEGRGSLQAVIRSALRLLGNSPAREGAEPPDAASRAWRSVLQFSRPAVAEDRAVLRPGDRTWWVRPLTAFIRWRTWRAYRRDPRTMARAAATATLVTAGFLLVVLLGVGFAVGFLAAGP